MNLASIVIYGNIGCPVNPDDIGGVIRCMENTECLETDGFSETIGSCVTIRTITILNVRGTLIAWEILNTQETLDARGIRLHKTDVSGAVPMGLKCCGKGWHP